MEYSNLRKIIAGILIYVVLMCNDVSIKAEESTKDRIQKHRAWLNQRTKDRQLVGYVETNDPFQKIKYFKKLIKFKNKSDDGSEIAFVPHEHSVHELTTIAIDTGNKFAYDTVNNNEVLGYDVKSTSGDGVLSSSSERNINNNIITTVDKQNLDTSKNNGSDEIERGGKIDGIDDASMRNTIEATSVSSAASIDSKNATSNDVEIQRFISEHIKYQSSSDVTIKKSWGKWSHWSSCSRTCGEGVSSQSRECILKHYKNGKRINVTTIALNECIGFFRRFRICNEKKCSQDAVDFRAQQCSAFDSKSFRGVQYTWVPYIKDDAECELNCKPIDQKYFAKLKDFVIDGTACKRVNNNASIPYDKAVCVEGKCKVGELASSQSLHGV